MKIDSVIKSGNKQSGVEIFLDAHSSNSIVMNRDFFEIDDECICMYFPQFKEVVYSVSPGKKSKLTLKQHIITVIQANQALFGKEIDSEKDQFIVREFGSNLSQVQLNALARWKKNRIQIDFKKDIKIRESQNETCIRINKSKDQVVQINLNNFKKMRVRQLLLFHNFKKYRFTSLNVNGKLIKHCESLEGIQLPPGVTEGVPLFSFQSLYHEMYALYEGLLKEGFKFESLIDVLTNKSSTLQYLEGRYAMFKSNRLNKLTQLAIIYFTSPFYKPSTQKEYFQNYFNGKIPSLEKDQETQLICTLIAQIQNISNPGSSSTIYYIQKIEEEENKPKLIIDEIIRFEAFSPAFTSKSSLSKLKQDYDIYEIDHLTAQYVGLYNGQMDGPNYLIMPFTEYIVESIETIKGNNLIKLVEIPTALHLHTNLVLWVDDKLAEGRQFKSRYLAENDLGIEIIFLKSNQLYELWLQKYYTLTNDRKVRVISNMARKEEKYAGLQTIILTRKYLRDDASILMYVGNVSKCIQSLQQQNLPDIDQILISDSAKILEDFILELAQGQDQSNVDSKGCPCKMNESVNCEIH